MKRFSLILSAVLSVAACVSPGDGDEMEPEVVHEVSEPFCTTCPPPEPCTYDTDCTHATACTYARCGTNGYCTYPSQPAGITCDTTSYPWLVCNGAGACNTVKPPTSNCITATTNGSERGGCNDNNPCTQDVWNSLLGRCEHHYYGLGSACGDPDFNSGMNMSCVSGGTGEQCCPVAPVYCTQIGVQAECASGSVCMEGRCWKTCDGAIGTTYVNPGACSTTPWPNCGSITEGATTRYICQ
jgi:hypothetical protein